MKFRTRAREEKGAVLVIVAVSMLALLTLTAGGIMLFTLYGANREMQKTADQAALAGAAALPLLRPGVALGSLNLNPVYELTDDLGLDTPIKGLMNVPDPRAVACAYGQRNLEPDSSQLIGSFGSAPSPSLGGYCSNAPWNEGRVSPTLNSLATPLTSCVNSLTSSINGLISQLQNSLNGLLGGGLLGGLLGGLTGSQATALVNDTIAQLQGVLDGVKNLEALSPALLTPEMTVTVRSGVNPPLLSFITGSDGVQMTVEATAERRLKNAIVLPSTPQLLNFNINTALAATKPQVMNALGTLNTHLNTMMGQLGLSNCRDLLSPTSKVVQDISDIYNPPASGVSPTGRDLITGSLQAAQRAASEAGTTVQNVAGEAFLVIRQGPNPSTLSNLLGPVFDLLGLGSTLGMLQIPAMDVALVAAHNLEDGNISNPDLIADAAAARGLFTATLVK